MSKTEPGQVINLMSNDVSRFDLVSQFLNFLWVMPFVVPVVAYLVWQHVSYATFAALLVIFMQTVLVQGKKKMCPCNFYDIWYSWLTEKYDALSTVYVGGECNRVKIIYCVFII